MYKAVQPLYSLTQDPRKYKFRQPPQIKDFDEIVEFYIERVSQESAIDDILFLLEMGLPIRELSDFITRAGMIEGIHSIETGFLVRPILSEYLKGIANQAGIEYKEEFSTKAEDEEKNLQRAAALAKKAMKGREQDEGYDLVMSAVSGVENDEAPKEDVMPNEQEQEDMGTEMSMEQEKPAQMEMDLGDREEQRPAGLMARG